MKKYFFLFIACFTVFVIHLIASGHGIYGDGNGYYSYTHAIYFEKSLNFEPIYAYLGNFQGKKYVFSRIFWDSSPGPLGILKNPYPIGTGLIWIPSLAIFSLFVTDKFSLLLEMGPGLTGIILCLLGIYFLEDYLKNFFSSKIASGAVLFFFFASNLFYYASFEPALSHQPAFFLISFLLWKTYKMKETLLNYFFVGALSGLLFITRIPDSVLLIPIFFQLFNLKPKFGHWIVMPIAALVFSLPLFASYYLMFGNAFHMPYLTGESGTFTFSLTKIVKFLFSAERGLLVWTPIYGIGILGLIKARKWGMLCSLTILFLISSFWSASNSAGFGQRFVLSGIPYFTIGLAALLEKMKFKYALSLFTVLFVWNFLTLFQFYFDSTDLIKNEGLTVPQFLEGQVTAPLNAVKIIRQKDFRYFFYNSILD